MGERTDWQDAADRAALEEPLSPEARERLRTPPDEITRTERDLYDALETLGQAQPLDPADLERVSTALEHRSRRPRTLIGAVAATSVVASLALLWLVLPDGAAVPEEPSGLHVSQGSLSVDDDEVFPPGTVPPGRWGRARETTCIRSAELEACVAEGTGIRLDDATLEFRDGAAIVEGEGVFRTDALTLDAAAAHFAVLVADGTSLVRVHAGTVVVSDGMQSATLHAGDRWPPQVLAQVQPPDPQPQVQAPEPEAAPKVVTPRRSAPVASPSELLEAARGHVAAGNPGAALRTYAELRKKHPKSKAAHASEVSSGQLQLQRGTHKAALASFSRYLSRGGGSLAEEAWWGKIRALHALGRKDAKARAIEQLRTKFPSSVYVDLARKL